MTNKKCKCGCSMITKKIFIRGHNLRINNPAQRLDVRQKFSFQRKGCIPWNKGKKTNITPMKGKTHSEQSKLKMSLSRLGKKRGVHTEETKNKIKKSLMNHEVSLETKTKISLSLIGKFSGNKNPSWLGGKSFEPYGIEFNEKLKDWIRSFCLYKCQLCLKHQDILNKNLEIHHIDYNKQNNIPHNLIALCTSCHMKTNFSRDRWQQFFQENIKHQIIIGEK